MRVRISSLDKGTLFTYKGRSYTMGTPGAKKDARGTFRWVVRHNDDGTTNWTKFRVHGAQMVTLGSTYAEQGASFKSGSASKKPQTAKKTTSSDDTRTKVARVLVSKGAHTYRVTAKWWRNGPPSVRGWEKKEFRVNSNNAADALAVVQKSQKNPNVKVTYTVAKVSE